MSEIAWLPTRWRKHLKLHDATEDLSVGQIVFVVGRWVLVLVMLLMAILDTGKTLMRLRLEILALLALTVFNFYLFTQALQRKGTLQIITYIASLADLIAITIIVKNGGYFSPYYVFYYPALLVISVTFPPFMLLIFTEAVMVMYTLIAFTQQFWIDSVPILGLRLLMMVAVVVCGRYYWEIEKARRAGDKVPAPTAEPIPSALPQALPLEAPATAQAAPQPAPQMV